MTAMSSKNSPSESNTSTLPSGPSVPIATCTGSTLSWLAQQGDLTSTLGTYRLTRTVVDSLALEGWLDEAGIG